MNRFKHKFHAIRTETEGIKFPSKKEAEYYIKLKLLQQSGEIVFFLRQIPFQLDGNTKAFIDFMEFWANGDIRFVDTKGMDTPISKLKRKQIEARYPVKILLV